METTCKLGSKGCWNDGKCRATSNCENKVVTNADRIRAMSDEELAKLIYGVDSLGWCKSLPECVKQTSLIPEEKCVGCALAWLQQPAED